MVNLTVPGVKVQEISTLAPSIAPVETAIPAFIGYTEKQPSPNGPVRIGSFLDFVQVFGGPVLAGVTVVVNNSAPYTIESISETALSPSVDYASPFFLYYAVKAFYDNGGGVCYVASADTYGVNTAVDPDKVETQLNLIAKEDEPTLILIPEAISLDIDDQTTLYQKVLIQAASLQDRFAIFDSMAGEELADIEHFRTGIGNNNLKYGAVYFPHVVSVYHPVTSNAKITVVKGMASSSLATRIAGAVAPFDDEGYVNRLISKVNAELDKFNITMGPSSMLAGIYSAVDFSRGVWKAPANVSVSGVKSLTVNVDDNLQDLLNVDPSTGKSINAIRTFAGKGQIVWGARTLAGNDNEWRYVNVRRLFIFVEESTKKATSGFVFEPNTAQTWLKVKAMIDNFLTNLWRQGALAGAKPEDAFFVNVGLGSTMTSDDILNGIMNVEIGLAPSRPAEFIVLKFSHKVQVS